VSLAAIEAVHMLDPCDDCPKFKSTRYIVSAQ
jgi:hypothetical protein